MIEAPDAHRRRDGVRALENFASYFGLRARRALMGFVNDTQQEIALLYDPDRLSAEHAPVDGGEAEQATDLPDLPWQISGESFSGARCGRSSTRSATWN